MKFLFTRFLHCDTVGGFSDEQKEELKSLFADFSKSMTPNPEPNPNPNPETNKKDDKSVIEQAKEQMQLEQAKAQEIAEAEIAVQFDMNFPKMKEEFKAFLPPEMDYVIKAIDAQNIESKSQKVKAIKAGIMDAAFQEQKTVDSLNDTQKAKVKKYKELTSDEKTKQANAYWEVYELALDALKTQARLSGVRDANGNPIGQSSDEARNKMNDKIFGQSKNIVREFN